MEKAARWIVRHRKAVLVIAVILLIPSVFGYLGTAVNYDILTYLPPELDSMIGETYLDEDFKTASTAMVTVENMPAGGLSQLKDDLSAIAGVEQVIWGGELLDSSFPAEMLPDDLQRFFYNEDGAALMIVRFSDTSASESTMDALAEMKKAVRKDCYIGGMSAILQDTRELVSKEMPLYILCAVGCCIVVLMLGLKSTAVPLLFMLGILFPIVYNFGTNIFLGQISYITQALATVLQLGVTMDFSIFLLHRYDEERECSSNEEAMVKAIMNTFTSITASSLTTIAGFLAMCTMSLTLGRDIGIVMAKGVFLGVVCTLTILPALIMTFDGAVHRYTHPTLIPRLVRTSKFVTRHYISILVVFVVLFIPFSIAQSRTPVYYTLFDSLPQDMDSIVGTNRLKEDFNMTTSHFIIVDDSLPSAGIREMSEQIGQVDGVTQVLSYEQFVGGGIPEEMIPEEIREIFHAGGKRMLLANSSLKSGSEEQNQQLDKINSIVKGFDPEGVISGEGAMTKDLIEVADQDFRNVSIASILAVFIIIALVFRSISVPILLVGAIESAILINMGIPYFTGSTLPFIASIVVGTIQLGATVDYAILMTTRFREELSHGLSVKEAVQVSVESCSQSILSSGLTFFAATAGVAAISKMELIQSLCLLISRGALISMAVILLVLPAVLIVFAPVIRKTTYHWIPEKESVNL